MQERHIFVTAADREKLIDLLATASPGRNDLKSLEAELQRAKIVEAREVPKTVVTMNTRLRFADLGDNTRTEVTLVFPVDANIDEGKISVLSPIGTALLGYAQGDTIAWSVPAGTRRIKIEKILYQPEAAGDLHL